MYAPLHVHSPFSCLDGASPIDRLVRTAADHDCPALAITDHDNVSAAIELYQRASQAGIKPIQGAEITVSGRDGRDHHLTLLATGPLGYSNLCRLLTRGHLDRPRRSPCVDHKLLATHATGLIALTGCRRGEIPSLILRGDTRAAEQAARWYRAVFRDRLYLELPTDLVPGNRRLIDGLLMLADKLNLEPVAAGNVHYAVPDQFAVHDVLTCIRTGTRLSDVHPQRRLNAEHYLKSADAMQASLLRAGMDRRRAGRALASTVEIADRCESSIVPDRRLYPEYRTKEDPRELLRQLTYDGARTRYDQITDQLSARIDHELEIINRLGYEGYFLLVWDIGRFAREKNIRFAGRGSAADSVVAYCLGLTEVDAFQRNLLFERFLSLERAQKPDIDLDFDSERRDEVGQYVRERYGSDHVAAVCTFNTFRARSAVRDIGKALDLPPEDIDQIARRLPHLDADDIESALTRFPELRAGNLDPARYGHLLSLCSQVAGLPRHIGTHLGGLVITAVPVTDVSPLQLSARGVTICQFDRDFVEDLGLLKLDLLSLRTLTAIDEAARLAAGSGNPIDIDRISPTDPAVMDMINRGDTIGVFQLESPAQRSLQSRLGASGFEDIVASIALIRPGPIKGNMVQPFIDRKLGREQVTYLHPLLEPILESTYGVVLYQEQVIEIATAIAGFTPGEADRLRRVMSHGRSRTEMAELGRLFTDRSVQRGISREVADQIFAGMEGYASYGFCEAHAAAFAATACRTGYLVRHRPAEFFAALLSCQPMGFYPPRVLCLEARRRGVGILGPDVNASGGRYGVERDACNRPAIRVGLMQIEGLGQSGVEALLQARSSGPFRSVMDVRRRTKLSRDRLISVVRAGAADSLSSNRRAALWEAAGGGAIDCADFSVDERVVMELEVLGFSVTAHPFSLLRSRLKELGCVSSRMVQKMKRGRVVSVAGIPVRPHRPPTNSGRTVVFLSLEDEFGLTEVTVFEDVYQRDGAVLFDGTGQAVVVTGKVDRRGRGMAVVADRIRQLGKLSGNDDAGS